MQKIGLFELSEDQIEEMKLPNRIKAMHKRFGKVVGRTCRECKYLIHLQGGRRSFLKCNQSVVTNGPATDWRAKWAACGKIDDQ